jgi:dTDP-4-amino-4,6-dideoxygalactose transaminase
MANHSYFPILVEASYPLNRDELFDKLKQNDIYSRRYFYPLISEFPMYREFPSAAPSNLPVAAAATQKVLCLPIYPNLSTDSQDRIIKLIAEV